MFVYDAGEAHATVYIGDVNWEPCRVIQSGGLPDLGDLILNREERAFLSACWTATALGRREPHK